MIRIRARVENKRNHHTAKVSTNDKTARASQEQIQELMRITDRKAEIQNTLRIANNIPLQEARAVPIE
jgi:hypothetical protein